VVVLGGACSGNDEVVPIDAAVAIDATDAAVVDATDAADIDAPDIDAPDIDAPVDGPEAIQEPMNGLMWIQLRADAYFQDHGTFPPEARALTPAGACCTGPGMQCQAVLADWAVAPWFDLGFAMTVPFRYQYSYVATGGGSAFVAVAHGDLDCDGTFSDYTLTCTSSGPAPICNISVPAIID